MGDDGLRTVVEDEERDVQLAVIDGNLVEDFLGQGDRFGLEFEKYERLEVLVIDDGVGALALQGHFDGDEVHRVAEFIN